MSDPSNLNPATLMKAFTLLALTLTGCLSAATLTARAQQNPLFDPATRADVTSPDQVVPPLVDAPPAPTPSTPSSRITHRTGTATRSAYTMAYGGELDVGSSRRGPDAEIIRFSEMGAEAHAGLAEDLNVMAYLIERDVQRSFGAHGTAYRLGVPILFHGGARGGRSVEATYLEGFGARFALSVNFPLVAPAETKAEPEKPAKTTDWETAKRELYGRTKVGGGDIDVEMVVVGGSTGSAPVEYSEERLEALKRALFEVLKNASNIRQLKDEEFVAVTVTGRASSGAPAAAKFLNVTRSGQTTTTQYVDPAGDNYTVAAPGTDQATMLSIRVKKSDIDAWAAGRLKPDDFAKKASVHTYRSGRSPGVTSVLDPQISHGR
jgi:hypothetical protein